MGISKRFTHLLNGCHHNMLDRFLKCHYLLDLLLVEKKTQKLMCNQKWIQKSPVLKTKSTNIFRKPPAHCPNVEIKKLKIKVFLIWFKGLRVEDVTCIQLVKKKKEKKEKSKTICYL